jgi:hypothetical protein
MKCPETIAEVVLEIITIGLLRVRHHAAAGDSHRCLIEADHIHNLPNLLANYSPELLRFYWTVERPALERQNEPQHLALSAALGAPWDTTVASRSVS